MDPTKPTWREKSGWMRGSRALWVVDKHTRANKKVFTAADFILKDKSSLRLQRLALEADR